jgi:hypothetical protein
MKHRISISISVLLLVILSTGCVKSAIKLSKGLKENIIFTQYTFFNIGTSAEFKVGLPEQLGPFEPGQLPLIAFDDPWPVPTETGHYEFRVYLGNRVVARALFNIRG